MMMTKEDLEKVLRAHTAWLQGDGGRGTMANLSWANLGGSNLSEADLRGADLRGADLGGSNLSEANLRGANLSWANLGGSNLSEANLGGADLREANLGGSNLSEADLRGADLGGSNLSEADLRGADLRGAKWSDDTAWPAPTMILLASWGQVSDGLTRDLMRFDAACHPVPLAFQSWADGGPCPYTGVHVQRAANFQERGKCWDPKSRVKRPYDLAMRLLAECCERAPGKAGA